MYYPGETNETGTRLETLRKEKGYTQEYVSKKIGVNISSYRAWEKGDYKKSDPLVAQPVNIRADNLAALADLYGVSVDYILGRTEYRTINGADIAKITGLSDQAISVLQWYGRPDNPMMYHVARDASQLISWLLTDWETQGGNSILQTLERYIQTEPGTAGRITPDTGANMDTLKAVDVDLNAVLLLQIVAACERYKSARTD